MSVTLQFHPKDYTVTETATGAKSSVRAAGDRHPASFLIKSKAGAGYWLRVDAHYCANRSNGWSFDVGIPANNHDFKFPLDWKIKVERSPSRSYMPILTIEIPDAHLIDVSVTDISRVITLQAQTQPNNSLSACLGTLLNIDVMDIPCFWSGLDFNNHPEWLKSEFVKRASLHLAKMGYGLMFIPTTADEMQSTDSWSEAASIGMFELGDRPSGWDSYVVFGLIDSKGELVFDPSPESKITMHGYKLTGVVVPYPTINRHSLQLH